MTSAMRHIVLTALLTGCVTTAGMQERQPADTFSSSRTLPEIEECLALRLSWLGNPSTIRGEHRIIMAYGNPNPAVTLTIREENTARIVELRAIATGARLRRNVQECR